MCIGEYMNKLWYADVRSLVEAVHVMTFLSVTVKQVLSSQNGWQFELYIPMHINIRTYGLIFEIIV